MTQSERRRAKAPELVEFLGPLAAGVLDLLEVQRASKSDSLPRPSRPSHLGIRVLTGDPSTRPVRGKPGDGGSPRGDQHRPLLLPRLVLPQQPSRNKSQK